MFKEARLKEQGESGGFRFLLPLSGKRVRVLNGNGAGLAVHDNMSKRRMGNSDTY